MKKLLLCTDLDRTLLPNGEQPESPAARALFRRLVKRDEVALVYVTGRHRELIQEAIETYDLPLPDYAVADVGSTIYSVDASGWQQLDSWSEYIDADWQGQSHSQLYQRLSVFPLLKLQEQEKQCRHKLSFYVPTEANIQSLIDEMQILLKLADIRANIIWSIDEAARVGLLDVLPARANKLFAIHFLMQQYDYTPENSIFAGDSGNDVDVLMSDIPSVLVANAHQEIKKLAESVHNDALYIAQGGYLGLNGNYSAGILEGVAHFFPETDAWLRAQI